MRIIDSFVPQPGSAGGLCVRHRVEPIEITLPGAVLEAQFALSDDDGYLLLTTADRPHEETLYFVLVDAEGRERERLELANAYVPGLLARLEVVPPHGLRFRFHPGSIHELEVHERGRTLLRRRRLELRTRPAPH